MRIPLEISILYVVQAPAALKMKNKAKQNTNKLTLLKQSFLTNQQEQLGSVPNNFNLCARTHVVRAPMSESTSCHLSRLPDANVPISFPERP